MLMPVFEDLIKPQWRIVLETLKHQGGMPVAEIARHTGGSYMAVKAHCEELTRSGYLVRTRLPRSEVGRPEIFYSLGARADALFPQAGLDFTLELLGQIRRVYGESAPDKLLFQYFQDRADHLAKALAKHPELPGRATRLAAIRTKDGCASRCDAGPPLSLVEHHNPLQRLFEHYPRAAAMETRMIEQALGARVVRLEQPAGRETTPRVVFEIAGA
jgi:predicted ArsR family transcriptional regulator